MIVRQTDEAQTFVARFKGKASSYTPQQIEFANSKYEQTMNQVNGVLDLIKQNTGGAGGITGDDFKVRARNATDTDMVFCTLMETAVDNATNFNSFVTQNSKTLPDAWLKVWQAVPNLTLQQRTQLFTFLDNRARLKTWAAVKKQ